MGFKKKNEFDLLPKNLLCCILTLSSIYTHFNTLEKKALENIVEKGEIAQNEQFHLFAQCFLYNLYLKTL